MILQRFYMGSDYTQGILTVNDLVFFTLELPWRDNQRNISCIPPGEYPIRVFKHSRWGNVVEIMDVPNRSGILIHPGNYVGDTEGCVLPGLTAGRAVVFNSRVALAQIVENINTDFIIVENLVEVV